MYWQPCLPPNNHAEQQMVQSNVETKNCRNHHHCQHFCHSLPLAAKLSTAVDAAVAATAGAQAPFEAGQQPAGRWHKHSEQAWCSLSSCCTLHMQHGVNSWIKSACAAWASQGCPEHRFDNAPAAAAAKATHSSTTRRRTTVQ